MSAPRSLFIVLAAAFVTACAPVGEMRSTQVRPAPEQPPRPPIDSTSRRAVEILLAELTDSPARVQEVMYPPGSSGNDAEACLSYLRKARAVPGGAPLVRVGYESRAIPYQWVPARQRLQLLTEAAPQRPFSVYINTPAAKDGTKRYLDVGNVVVGVWSFAIDTDQEKAMFLGHVSPE